MKATTMIAIVAVIGSVVPFATAGTVHDVTVGPGGMLVFSPDEIVIEVGDTVRWTWGSGGHNVGSGLPGAPTDAFLSGPPADEGTVFEVVFDQKFLDANPIPNNLYDYHCHPHGDLFDMIGSVEVESKTTTTTPVDFNAFRGFLDSGTLADVLESDDSDLCHGLGITIFPSEAPITLDFDGTLPTDSPASLDVTFESSANTPGLELTISMWNYNTSSWDIVGTAAQGFNVDVVRTFPGVPADHVEVGTGAVRTRYEVRQAGIIFQFPWLDCIDHVFWTTTN